MPRAYTIDIPGMTDIFITPVTEGYPTWREYKEQGKSLEEYHRDVPKYIRQLRRKRVARMMTKRSPLPDFLQKIPQIINHIDDAQDLLITALTLAKPLLKRLPARFIPGIGWILLASDILNLATALLAIPLTGGAGKATARSIIRQLAKGKAGILTKVPDFLGKTRYLPFLLQAGQAMESLTGYGLRLGGVMGMVSDAIWGGIRKLSGEKVIVRKPPPQDPVGKALRVLSQAHKQVWYQDILTPYEEAVIIAANNIAVQILQDAGEVPRTEERAEIVQSAKEIIYEPWDPESIESLQEAGLPTVGEEMHDVHDLGEGAEYVDIIRRSAELERTWQLHRRQQYKECDGGTIMQMIHSEAGEGIWEMLTGTPGVVQPVTMPEETIILKTIEWTSFPREGRTPMQIQSFFYNTQQLLQMEGRDWPTKKILETAWEMSA